MFTGLIKAICTVKSAYTTGGGMHLAIDLDKLVEESKIGDSIAINGACLTISELDSSIASFDLSAETLTKSTLGKLNTASQVNVEPALKIGDQLGGHIVTGHIDGTAKIKTIKKTGQFANIRFTAAPELLDQMLVKGSVAVDGISLTIASMDESCFTAAIIPQTLRKTTLAAAEIGDTVNIETDIIVKIIKKHLDKILSKEKKLTIESLKELGF
jgi:riboflavin synthase